MEQALPLIDAVVIQLINSALCGNFRSITLYWLTNTGVSSARLYWENKAGFFEAKNISQVLYQLSYVGAAARS
jgi:hypothetical protein